MWEFEEDITFCMDECDNLECFRNRKRASTNRPHSYAFLQNTEYCPKNNIKENDKK